MWFGYCNAMVIWVCLNVSFARAILLGTIQGTEPRKNYTVGDSAGQASLVDRRSAREQCQMLGMLLLVSRSSMGQSDVGAAWYGIRSATSSDCLLRLDAGNIRHALESRPMH